MGFERSSIFHAPPWFFNRLRTAVRSKLPANEAREANATPSGFASKSNQDAARICIAKVSTGHLKREQSKEGLGKEPPSRNERRCAKGMSGI
jgi:hypothetical protein